MKEQFLSFYDFIHIDDRINYLLRSPDTKVYADTDKAIHKFRKFDNGMIRKLVHYDTKTYELYISYQVRVGEYLYVYTVRGYASTDYPILDWYVGVVDQNQFDFYLNIYRKKNDSKRQVSAKCFMNQLEKLEVA